MEALFCGHMDNGQTFTMAAMVLFIFSSAFCFPARAAFLLSSYKHHLLLLPQLLNIRPVSFSGDESLHILHVSVLSGNF